MLSFKFIPDPSENKLNLNSFKVKRKIADEIALIRGFYVKFPAFAQIDRLQTWCLQFNVWYWARNDVEFRRLQKIRPRGKYSSWLHVAEFVEAAGYQVLTGDQRRYLNGQERVQKTNESNPK